MTANRQALREEWESHHEGWTTGDFIQNDDAGREDASQEGAFVIFATRETDGERIAGTGDTEEEAIEALTTAAIRLRMDPSLS